MLCSTARPPLQSITAVILLVACCLFSAALSAQGPKQTASAQDQAAASKPVPGWTTYLNKRTHEIAEQSRAELERVTDKNWPDVQKQWRSELQEMLGLSPWPERTDLNVKIAGQSDHEGYRLTNLAYEAKPGLIVAANLYEPRTQAPAGGFPAILYVCGHANMRDEGRLLGNKTNYQHHGIWFARHNAVCLIIDTIQLGEFHGEHHGTYKMGRWDWITRGYTPAGVEAWSGIRAIDYLESLPTVDRSRIGITGRSGGGAYSWFTAALDDRIKAAVPVAGITDLENHVIDGCVEGHCDCMYFVNNFGWDYNRLAALIAPRALLVSNSDNDSIFPLDGVMRIHHDLVGLYKRLGANNKLGLLMTPGPHQDTQELQVGAFRWLMFHLTGKPIVVDEAATKELEFTALQVFEKETPANQRVSSVASWFVPASDPISDPKQAAELWRKQWSADLDRLWPANRPTAVHYQQKKSGTTQSIAWRWFQEADVESDWVSQLLILESDAARGASSNNQSPTIHIGVMGDQPLDESKLADYLKPDGLLRKLVDAEPNRAHVILYPRSEQLNSRGLSVRARTQLERRFYLLGDTTERLALADLEAQLRWLAQQQLPGLDSKNSALHGYGRWSPLAVLCALKSADEYDASKKEKRNDRLPQVQACKLVDYPTSLLLSPSLPGLLRVTSFSNLLQAARGRLNVETVDTHSPGIASEGYASTRRVLVDTSREPQQASGLRIVETSADSTKIWCRATRWPLPNLGDIAEVEFADDPAIKVRERRVPILPADGTAGLSYAAPGVTAEMRVRYRTAGKGYWQETPWQSVAEATDYSTILSLSNLSPDTAYEIQCQARAVGRTEISSTQSGSFRTLPAADARRDFRLAIGTCQEFEDRDGEYGMDLYRTLLHRKTDAFVLAGDVVYYDKLARSVPLAFYHWQRMYSMPTLVNFHRQVPTYFLKDDHDTYVNDSWPGQYFKWTREFTFEDGQRIFRQQTALPDPAYRTVRIGRDLQVWFMEGRDYRSPNDQRDSANKNIWGAEQWKWLTETLAASDARFKLIISPTPIVGPDRDNKGDNYANSAFATEGKRVRETLSKIPNLVVICGDRHWQYHSRDPETGLHEFSVGPVSNRHAGGWDPKDFRKEIHQYMRVGGGYLEVELKTQGEDSLLSLTHLDPYGEKMHSYELKN